MITPRTEFKSIDEYISSQPANLRPTLEKLRQTIRKAAPKAEEVISYQMPAYKYHGVFVYFAAFKNHFGFYPTSTAVKVFKDKLKIYECSKGTIKFPLDKPIPTKLVTEIVTFRVRENLDKKLLKENRTAAKRHRG
jgi:uncharacterized protein YdhG (YjbR/CyaY superfamily)